MNGGKMNKHIIFIFVFLLFGCQNESNKKVAYELQEKCSKSAEHWIKQYNDVIDYKTHYNEHLNKCFILITASPINTPNTSLSYYSLFDVNENKEYGHIGIMTHLNGSSDSYYINIKGNLSDNQAKTRWDAFVKEIMEQ